MITVNKNTNLYVVTNAMIDVLDVYNKIKKNYRTLFILKLELNYEKNITVNYEKNISVNFQGNNDQYGLIFHPPIELVNDRYHFTMSLIGKTLLINSFSNGFQIIDYDVNASIEKEISYIEDYRVIGFRVTSYPLYEVLKLAGKEVRQQDNRIEIKYKNDPKMRSFLVNEHNYVISKDDEESYYLLTHENIEIIFDEYYKNNKDNRVSPGYTVTDHDDDKSYKYTWDNSHGINQEYVRYHKSNGSVQRRSSEYVLVFGQILPEKIAKFLDDRGGFKKGLPLKVKSITVS